VSPACAACYAETFSNKVGESCFGPKARRRTFGTKHWREPEQWNTDALLDGEPRRVFCSSMCDIWEDHPTITAERVKLWSLIRFTTNLQWLLLTKRPERIAATLPDRWLDQFRHVWLGTSVENQQYADLRIPHLLALDASVRWLSVEPLLGPVDLTPYLHGLTWVIVGGESGERHRPMDHAWVRALRDQCVAAGVAFFMKQSSALRTETDTFLLEADGSKWEWKQYPGQRTPPRRIG
jgi:protein gp37